MTLKQLLGFLKIPCRLLRPALYRDTVHFCQKAARGGTIPNNMSLPAPKV